MISEHTGNISFKQYQYILQDADVENCFFMNETKDKSLVDIDVYEKLFELRNDTEARSKFIERVKKECANNIWYYFREVVRIPTEFNVLNNVDMGLARFPLTDKIARILYLYEKERAMLIPVDDNCKKGTSKLIDMTFAFLAIYEEFLDTKSDFPYVVDTMIGSSFRDAMQKYLWGINSIIGSIDGMVPTHSSTMPWNFGIFENKNKNDRDRIIFTNIKSESDLREFLEYSDVRGNTNCVGKIDLRKTHMYGYDIVNRFILDPTYSTTPYSSYWIYDDKNIESIQSIFKI